MTTHVSRAGWLLVFGAALGLLTTPACNRESASPAGVATNPGAVVERRTEENKVSRGKYLVTVAACGDCHTPWKMGPNGPEPDMSRALSGHPESLVLPAPPAMNGPWLWAGAATNTAFAGPWGVSYAINLTPDRETGIGLWSEQVFINAIKTGRHMGAGRPILPPMPWPAYSQFTDEDLLAMFAYLRTLEPRQNRVPEPVLAPPPATGAAAPSGGTAPAP